MKILVLIAILFLAISGKAQRTTDHSGIQFSVQLDTFYHDHFTITVKNASPRRVFFYVSALAVSKKETIYLMNNTSEAIYDNREAWLLTIEPDSVYQKVISLGDLTYFHKLSIYEYVQFHCSIHETSKMRDNSLSDLYSDQYDLSDDQGFRVVKKENMLKISWLKASNNDPSKLR